MFLRSDSFVIFFSEFSIEVNNMHCISRTDDKDKNLFVKENIRKSRWNIYSQIAIENDTLKCLNEVYNLTQLCNHQIGSNAPLQPCTLLDTNEVVNIGLDFVT